MPLKSILIILVCVAVASLFAPDWSWVLIFIWMGGLALLWVITGYWTSPGRKPAAEEQADPVQEKAVEAEPVRPVDGSVDADDLDDLARLDGELPATGSGKEERS